MIEKHSLLDAYLALTGSPVAHFALLLALVTHLQYPTFTDEEHEFQDACRTIYIDALVTHSLACVGAVLAFLPSMRNSSLTQTFHVATVLANLWLINEAFHTYILIQNKDLLTGSTLNPNSLVERKYQLTVV